MEYLFIAVGLFAIICTIMKPDFYWNSRKAIRMRRILGDTGTSLFYIAIGICLVIGSALHMIGIV